MNTIQYIEIDTEGRIAAIGGMCKAKEFRQQISDIKELFQ